LHLGFKRLHIVRSLGGGLLGPAFHVSASHALQSIGIHAQRLDLMAVNSAQSLDAVAFESTADGKLSWCNAIISQQLKSRSACLLIVAHEEGAILVGEALGIGDDAITHLAIHAVSRHHWGIVAVASKAQFNDLLQVVDRLALYFRLGD